MKTFIHPLTKTEVMTPKDFAAECGISRLTIGTWISERKIRAEKVGGRFFVPVSELERLKAKAKHHQGDPHHTSH